MGEKNEVKALTETLHLNLAACYLRTEQYTKCISACSTAIGVNDTSAKGYFRRGQAYLKVGNVDNAEADLKKAANLSPGDVAIRKELQKVGAEKKRQSQKQAKTFKGFFDKGKGNGFFQPIPLQGSPPTTQWIYMTTKRVLLPT